MEEPKRDAATEPGRAGAVKGAGSASASEAERRVSRERTAPNLDQRVTSLAAAVRRARIDNAEHSNALADLRGAELARLEILRDQLQPVLAQIPRDCDLFDVGIAPGERPRLFVDQIGFVEMGRDRRLYRFLQDTRHGRITIGESDRLDDVVEAITAYIAHRLIERDKALAVDYASGGSAGAFVARATAERRAAETAAAGGSNLSRKIFLLFLFLAEFLGSAVFFGLLGILGIWLYRTFVTH